MKNSRSPVGMGTVALWLAAAAVLAASFVWSGDALPRLHVCVMYQLTGIPCPGCGLSRAFCAISHGEFSRAWGYNPFGFLLYGLAVTALLWPLLAYRFPAARKRVLRSRALALSPIVLVIAMWAYGLARVVSVLTGGG